MDREELEGLDRESLIVRAQAAGIRRARILTRPELIDELLRLDPSTDALQLRKSRGFFGRARDLVARVVERGLHLPDAADRIRGHQSAADVSDRLGTIREARGLDFFHSIRSRRQTKLARPIHAFGGNLEASVGEYSAACGSADFGHEANGSSVERLAINQHGARHRNSLNHGLAATRQA